MISISINGTAVNQFNLEVPITETLDSELDTFSFVIKSHTKQTFNKYSRVQLTFSEISYSRVFALQDYTEKLQGETWIYNIDCISPTKILENIIINGMAITQGNFGQELNKAIKKIITQVRLQGSSDFTLTPVGNLSSLISEIYSNMFFKWDGQHTAREIFDDMLGRINYYIYVTDFEISGNEIVNLYLDCKSYNGAENSNNPNYVHVIGHGTSIEEILSNFNSVQPDNYKIANVETYNESEYEVPNIDGILQNGVDKNAVIYCGCNKLRSDALGIYSNPDQLCYITTEPIYDIKYFNIFIPILVTCKYYHGRNGYNSRVEYEQNVTMYFPVTIAGGSDEDYSGIFGRYLFEKTEFDTLTTEQQKYGIWYERGKNNLYGFTKYYKDGFAGRFNDIAIDKIITKIRNDFPVNLITDGRMTYYWDEYISEPFEYCYGFQITNNYSESTCYFLNENMQLTDHIIVPKGSGPWAVDTSVSVWHWENGQTVADIPDDTIVSMTKAMNQNTVTCNREDLSYDLAYYPYISSLIRLKKRDNERDEVIPGYTKNLSIMSNQSDKSVDIMNYLKAQQSTVDSMGERVMIIDTKITSNAGGMNIYGTRSPWELGDYFMVHSGNDYNYWKLVKRDITFYNEDTIKVRYYFSYNYNHAISAAIDREKMSVEIPIDGFVDRYIYIDGNSVDLSIPSDSDTIVTDAFDANENDVYAAMPLVKFGSNHVGINSYTNFYKTTFYDNYSVAIYRDTISGTKIYAPLRYTDSDGSLKDLRVWFTTFSTLWRTNDMSKFPRIGNFDIQSYDSIEFKNIYKDPFERLILVIEL